MNINDKIRYFRGLKGWSQEEMAEKLNMSVGGYSNIERGETNIQFSRLEQISRVLGVKLSDLTDLDKTSFRIFLTAENNNDNQVNNVENQVTISFSDEQLQHKIEQQQKEILYLKNEVNYLKEIIELMKKS